MPTTEFLSPDVGADSKQLGRSIAPQMEPPRLPGKGVAAHRNKAKWWLAAGAVVVIALGSTFYFRGSSQPAYLTSTIDRGDIEAAITATGTVNAVKTVQVGSQVSGNILALYADFNTKVKQGQLV